jgi:hypothetical protein
LHFEFSLPPLIKFIEMQLCLPTYSKTNFLRVGLMSQQVLKTSRTQVSLQK